MSRLTGLSRAGEAARPLRKLVVELSSLSAATASKPMPLANKACTLRGMTKADPAHPHSRESTAAISTPQRENATTNHKPNRLVSSKPQATNISKAAARPLSPCACKYEPAGEPDASLKAAKHNSTIASSRLTSGNGQNQPVGNA